jgi:hypothetical protein
LPWTVFFTAAEAKDVAFGVAMARSAIAAKVYLKPSIRLLISQSHDNNSIKINNPTTDNKQRDERALFHHYNPIPS